jgi:LysR family nitrogen assimilation transcriptional regulator
VKLRQLKNFLLIAETGNLLRAAAHLGVAQPALSRDLKLLEEELSTRLFIRDGRGVSLTRDGAIFRAAIASHVAGLDAAKQALIGRRNGTAGSIRLGWTGTISIPLASRVISAFTQRFPGVELHARGGSSLQIAEWLARDEIDIGVFNSERAASGSLVETLMSARLFHVARAGGEAAPTISFTEATATPLFMHSRENALGRIVETCAREHDIALKIYAEVDDFVAVRPMIEEGHGAAIVPLSLLHGGGLDRVAIRRVTDPDLTLYFHLAVSKIKRSNPTVRGLAETIRSELRQAIAQGHVDGEFRPA